MKIKKIEFYKHNINSADIKNCIKVLKSDFLTTGAVVKQFEEKFAKFMGSKYAIGVSSCTEGMFLVLKWLDIKKGDEVITTPLSFVATSNVIEYCGAKPVFVDVDKNTGNIDPNLIEKSITKKTKAIIVVHLYGLMCEMDKIKEVALKHKIPVIEDSAHCIEGSIKGIRPGQNSVASCFSFYATKNITSGEGGAIATNNRALYEWLLSARSHGLTLNASDRYHNNYKHYDVPFLGYKSNMTNIQAALLVGQLERIKKTFNKKAKIAEIYNKNFKNNKNIKLLNQNLDSIHARHIYTILVNPKKRDLYLKKLQDKKIGVSVNFNPIHLMSYYKRKYGFRKGLYPNAEYIGASTITIPLYPKLKNSEIKYIIESLNSIVKE